MLHFNKRHLSVCAVPIKRYISIRVAKSLVRLRWKTRGYLHFCPLNLLAWGPAIIRPLRFFVESCLKSCQYRYETWQGSWSINLASLDTKSVLNLDLSEYFDGWLLDVNSITSLNTYFNREA